MQVISGGISHWGSVHGDWGTFERFYLHPAGSPAVNIAQSRCLRGGRQISISLAGKASLENPGLTLIRHHCREFPVHPNLDLMGLGRSVRGDLVGSHLAFLPSDVDDATTARP